MKLGPAAGRLLSAARARRRVVRFFQLAGWVGVALCAAEAGLSLLVRRQVLSTWPAAALAILALLGLAGLGLLVVAAFALRSGPSAEIAAAVEDAHPALQDRLNTLVFLESESPVRGRAEMFRRIEQQLARAAPRGTQPAYRARPALYSLLALVLALLATVELNRRLRPWDHLSWPSDEALLVQKPGDDAHTFAPPPPAAEEVHGRWGEVRITEPGHDIKATKVDVVALQVEAATEGTLTRAALSTAVNGAKSEERPLPPSTEPHYGVYKPQLALDELHLQDWDLVSYSASASTAGPNGTYGSDIYFIEVRPFVEQIAKLPGGQGGKAFAGLNELTGLIDQQRNILRETHRFLQSPPKETALRRQDLGKLAQAERELAATTRRFYARLAAEHEDEPIGETLTRLDRAHANMRAAGDAVEQDSPEARPREQAALAELVATRKAFQKFVNDHPEAFSDHAGDADEESVPLAGLDQRLAQILELRDARKAARGQVDRLAAAQKRLAAQAAKAAPGPQHGLAQMQEQLHKQLQDLRAAQPHAFKGVEPAADEAARGMKQSASALDKGEGGEATQGAAETMTGLQNALQQQGEGHELGDAYRLKEAVDRERDRLRKMGAAPGRFSPREARAAADNARKAVRGLKDVSDGEPGRALFGPELGKALDEASLRRMEADLDAVAKAPEAEGRGRAATTAGEDLKKLSEAFEQSEPAAAKALRADRLRPADSDALQRALDALESQIARGESGRRVSNEDDLAKQRHELLLDLERGLAHKGDEARGRRLLLQVEGLLSHELTGAERVKLKQLKEEIERFQADLAGPVKSEREQTLTRVDPAQLPAAYRTRIQRYYQKLSEHE